MVPSKSLDGAQGQNVPHPQTNCLFLTLNCAKDNREKRVLVQPGYN